MTTETSNARRKGRPGIDRLWDSQWVNIVNSPEVLDAMRSHDCEGAVNAAVRMAEQKMAENFAATPPPPADAAYDRELIARMLDVCGHPMFTLDAYREQARLLRAADNASAQAETVSRPAADAEVRLIDLDRAMEVVASICGRTSSMTRYISEDFAALSQQPEARGVVDLKVVEAEVLAVVPGGDSCDPQQIADDIREVFAALTEARNVR